MTPNPPDVVVTVTLDVTGRSCPVPVIELAKAIGTLQPPAVIEVITDDAAAAADIPAWCAMRGQELLGTRPHGSATGFLIRSTAG